MAISAKFRGVCTECSEPIDIDEMIEQRPPSVDWVHVTCPDTEQSWKRPGFLAPKTSVDDMGY